MIKYRRSIEAEVLIWMLYIFLLAGIFFVAHTWKFSEFLILFCILELPVIIIVPFAHQAIKIDDRRINLCWWVITFRTFLWSEVQETGIAYVRAGYGTYKKYIYVSKRPVTNQERFNIHGVKDHKNFITMENRGHIIEDIKKYSKLPFRDLPTTEDFNNM
ncbi:hypothetical protein CAFE_32750 [Caprobacter fermentans]|uniref:Uncharacterized protein n=1 Tax=Caproicibacter fermentans TaxID=2576756 RepID=A0A6N8I3M7_9FIRM|nr:hypothetical protein [Caproicibacter fermentans]MVB12535.1 hypothetical protein [Caproicibacter fermentans]